MSQNYGKPLKTVLRDSQREWKSGEDISRLELNYIGIAHFGIHENPYKLIDDAIISIDKWVNFVKDIPELSNKEAAQKLKEWVIQNYKALKIDDQTIKNYMQNSNFEMQVWGLRNSLIQIVFESFSL